MMKSVGVLSGIALFLLLGFSPMADARQEKQEDKPNPQKQEQPAKPEKQQQESKAQKQEPQAKPEKQPQQAKAPKQEPQAKPEKQPQQVKGQQEQPQKQQQEQAKSNKQQNEHSQQQVKSQQEQPGRNQTTSSHGPQRTQKETATQQAQPELRLSSRGNGRIPDERFRSHFGRGHEFRMGNPVMVGGYSRFQYGGYWFGYVQPWPVGWFYTDQFYIDYVDGGYYMYDPYYPGARFAITVVI